MTNTRNEFVAGLFKQYGQQLFRFLRNRLRGSEVEDIAQETYLHLLQSPQAEAAQNPRAFLFKTAANLIIDRARYDKVRERHAASNSGIEYEPSDLPTPEEATHYTFRFEQLLRVLNELPADCRHVFLLSWFDGIPNAEIAARLGVSKRTVERHIVKAIDHCFHRLNDRSS